MYNPQTTWFKHIFNILKLSKKVGAQARAPWYKPRRSGGEVDRIDRGVQLVPDGAVSEHSSHDDDDTSREDHVLERHHAVVVRAQTMQRFSGLDVELQHR